MKGRRGLARAKGRESVAGRRGSSEGEEGATGTARAKGRKGGEGGACEGEEEVGSVEDREEGDMAGATSGEESGR